MRRFCKADQSDPQNTRHLNPVYVKSVFKANN